MARRPCTFRQQDVTRALRAAAAAGIEVHRYEIYKDGKIVVIAGKQPSANLPKVEEGGNEWDRI